MNNKKDKQNRLFLSQNRYWPIILWLFPLILINLGWYSITLNDYRWEENERIEQAKQEVEKLAASSDFSYCFSKIAGNFFNILKAGSDIYTEEKQSELLIKHLNKHANYLFSNPFPEHELFVFQIPKNQRTKIIYTNQKDIKGKRALELSFEYLSKINSLDKNYSDLDKKKGADITRNLWGGQCNPSAIAETQKGKSTYSLYKQKPSRFFWDYLINEKNGNIIGFYLITDYDKNFEINGKLLALKNYFKSNNLKDDQKYAAFIPLFPGYGGVITDERFKKLPEYKMIIQRLNPKNLDGLENWLLKISTEEKGLIIGNYQVFIHLVSGQSHCAILLLPLTNSLKFPKWLFLFNIIFISIILFLLVRGFLLGIWNQTSLKVRFFTSYFQASCIPIGLLIILTYAYISEYKHSQLFDFQSKLKFYINQFDIRQTKSQDEYRTNFMNIKNDKKLVEAFKEFNDANEKTINEFIPEAKKALSLSVDSFNNNQLKLPILSFTIMDEKGNIFTNIGNNNCQYHRILKSNKYENIDTDKTYNEEEKQSKLLTENTLDQISYSLLQPLRSRIESMAPNSKKWTEELNPTIEQKAAAGGFKQAVGNSAGSLSEEIYRRRNIVITRAIGNKLVSYIYDYISVGGIPRFVILMYWDVRSLDEITVKATMDYFALKESNLNFSTFKATSHGMKTWISSRHWQNYKITEDLTNQAFLSKTTITYSDDTKTIIAVPSKKYSNTIIVGSISHHLLNLPVFNRVLISFLIIALSLLVYSTCVSALSSLFLKPIDNLKKVLDKVANGIYDTEIRSKRKDELGTMCQEFSNMTHELSERDKLATLLSDYAVEALSKKDDNESISNIEQFIGTVLVSDIRNFTGMSEKYEPEQITNLLNEHFAVMTRIITKNGGRIYKYIGDAIEVVFANKDSYEKSSVERAFNTSIEMLEGLKNINEKRKTKGLFEYRIGIGLSYGKMLSGSIGSLETRLDYALLGNALNNAAKLESLSKLNPELPIVVSKGFVNVYNYFSPTIVFTPIQQNNGNEAFVINANSLEILKNNEKASKNEIENIYEKFYENKNKKTNKTTIIEVEDDISFKSKITYGFSFLFILCILSASALFFYYSLQVENQKSVIIDDNQRLLEQMACDDYGRVAFDTISRKLASSINKQINEINEKELTESVLTKILEKSYKSDELFTKLNKLFIWVGDYEKIINASDTEFCDKIPIKPIGNNGFTNEEAIKISQSYRVCVALNELDNITQKLSIGDKKNEFQQPYKKHMERNYGEPSREVFGENALIALLYKDLLNSSIEVTYKGNNHYLYTLDFYKRNKDNKPKLIGYLIISLKANELINSLPMLLNAYSQNNQLIALKKQKNNDWYFSKNISDKIKKDLISFKFDIDYIENYFKRNNQIATTGILNIANHNYYVFIANNYLNNNKSIVITIIIFIFLSVFSFIYFVRIIKGNTIVNSSVSAKLWLNLIIVAILPILTMIIVFNLFINDYKAVTEFKNRAKLLKFNDNFELKTEFAYPLIWNYARKKNKSNELNKCIDNLNKNNQSEDYYKNTLEDLRTKTEKWNNEHRDLSSTLSSIINYYIADIIVSGEKGWSFCLSDKEDSYKEKDITESIDTEEKDEDLASVSYREVNIDNSQKGYGIMFKFFAKALLNNRGKSGDTNSVAQVSKNQVINEMGLETAFKTVKTFFGEDTFLQFSNGINNPIILDIGFGKLAIMINPIPTYKNPKAIVVWMVSFKTFGHLVSIANKIKKDFDIYLSENFRYGIVGKRTYDNEIRIPLGQKTAWVSTSNLPISSNINIKNDSYLIECMPAKTHFNTVVLYLYPEKLVQQEVNKLVYYFYFLLGISIIIIIVSTKNIASDITNPINVLIDGIKEVNRENFSFRINSDRTDELGALCNSFDKMIKGLDEKRMMSHMVSNTAKNLTFSEDGAKSTKSDCVLLYISIPKFNDNISNLDNEIFASLNNQTSLIAKVIMDENGEIDKIIGEKILAVFPIRNNKKKALLSAYRASKRILGMNNLNELPFPVSMGLNYGNVINGFLGVGNKRDFTVIGDPVNVTARIESLAETLTTNRCLMSESFYEQVSNDIEAKEYDEVELKGKSQAMKVYQIV